MNLLFYLTPKSETTYIYNDYTVRETLEIMGQKKYSAVPIISKRGEYIGTITEGDLLWGLKDKFNTSLHIEIETMQITKIKRRMDNSPISINAKTEKLLELAIKQNFVPIIDDNKTFIGIVKRKEIMEYCYKKMEQLSV